MVNVQLFVREPEGIVKAVEETRMKALWAARDLLGRRMVVVTIIGDGRINTVEEFTLAITNKTE